MSDEEKNLGLGLKPGDPHYRAFVGPPEDYDLIAAMTFNLLTTLGLRQHHRVLDIGCGSLRIGRLLIPYLNAGNYVAIEPNAWLVEEGIKREVGHDLMTIKKPVIHMVSSADALKTSAHKFDFAFAQSIFSHCGLDLIAKWLNDTSVILKDDGILVATFLLSQDDYQGSGWIYPDCVSYQFATIDETARNAGLRLDLLDWYHPRQTWALLAKPDFDSSWTKNVPLSWNTLMRR